MSIVAEEQRLLTKIGSMRSEIVQFTKDLMSIKSISPGAEYDEIGDFLQSSYRSAGLEVKTLTASKERIELIGFKYPRYNVLARLKGNGNGPTLAIFSHMDTVDAVDLDKWHSDPFHPSEKDDKIFGLGAIDARCSIACAFFAAKAILESKISLKGDLIVIGVVDDEVVYDERFWPGTPFLVEEGHKASGWGIPDYVINGEGSGLSRVVNSFKGRYTFEIEIEGLRAHAGTSYGVNSVEKALEFLRAIKLMELKESQTMGKDLITVFALSGGKEGLIDIPNKCLVGVDIRFVEGFGKDRVKRFVEDTLEKLKMMDTDFRVSRARIIHDWEPATTDPTGPLVKAIINSGQKMGMEILPSGLFGAGQNLPYVIKRIPCVTYGAGEFDRPHAPNEYVGISELISQTMVYALTALDVCGMSSALEK